MQTLSSTKKSEHQNQHIRMISEGPCDIEIHIYHHNNTLQFKI